AVQAIRGVNLRGVVVVAVNRVGSYVAFVPEVACVACGELVNIFVAAVADGDALVVAEVVDGAESRFVAAYAEVDGETGSGGPAIVHEDRVFIDARNERVA